MKNTIKYFLLVLLIMGFSSCNLLPDTWIDALSGASLEFSQDGNSLFHQTDEVEFQTGNLEILGEVSNPGFVDFEKLYEHEVVIKEAVYNKNDSIEFIGAYRYKGYTLFDILHTFNLDKKNADIFRPTIDAYIVIENDEGESVVFSWSEIFHTNNPNQILIATKAAPIIPYKTEVDYTIGEKWKVVAANDLFTYRTLEDPVKITVYSFDKKEYKINRDLDPLYSPSVNVIFGTGKTINIPQTDDDDHLTRYYSTFYGMGMGYHEAQYFEGPSLNMLLKKHINQFDLGLIRNGLVCFAGIDGYRAIYSYSELFNRVDQVAPILAQTPDPMDGGFYRLFHPLEFYADRSVKGLAEIFFFKQTKSEGNNLK